MRPPRGALLAAALTACDWSSAHGFGARYDLPLPLPLYLTGAALTVALSFVVLGVVLRFARTRGAGREAAVSVHAPWLLNIARALGVAIYLLVLVAGFFGTQNPFKNIAPLMVWALWWVGMALLAALIGNFWPLFNPLDGLFAWTESLLSSENRHPPARYPGALGLWPAVLLLLIFVWMEIAWEGSDRPASLALAVLAYSVITWSGMLLFGRERWLAHGEVFAVVFAVLGRFAPIELRVGDGRIGVRFRPPGEGLFVRTPAAACEVVLVVVLLSAVSFDGFVETPAWSSLAGGMESPVLARSIGLVLAPLLFLAVFLLVSRGCAAIAQRASPGPASRTTTWDCAGLFAYTLVPIAIAYQLSHYLSFLVMGAQYAIPLASDPLGRGWNLFGSVRYFVRPGLIDARMIWDVSLTAIVTGHVAAVYLAHVQALRAFADRRVARLSQYPMILLMIGYTMLSLWIIAQPIVSIR